MLSIHQSGSRKNHSIQTLQVFTLDRISQAIDNKCAMAVILLDLSKAFDSIGRYMFLTKLETMSKSFSY
jgi:hypothetical protein